MPTIKIPMTTLIREVPAETTHIAMDSDAEWFAYNKKPMAGGVVWKSYTEEGKPTGEYVLIRDDSGNPTQTFELLDLLKWNEAVFTVEEVLCQ